MCLKNRKSSVVMIKVTQITIFNCLSMFVYASRIFLLLLDQLTWIQTVLPRRVCHPLFSQMFLHTMFCPRKPHRNTWKHTKKQTFINYLKHKLVLIFYYQHYISQGNSPFYIRTFANVKLLDYLDLTCSETAQVVTTLM